MSLVSGAMTSALSIVNAALGESLWYRTAHGGTWVVLTGFVLDRDDVQVPQYNELDGAENTVRGGRLSGPLTPAMALGYEIKDGSADVWAVDTVEFDQQQLVALRRTTIANAGPNRGGAA